MMAIIYNVFINVVRLSLIIFGMVIAMTIVCEWNALDDCKDLGTYARFYQIMAIISFALFGAIFLILLGFITFRAIKKKKN